MALPWAGAAMQAGAKDFRRLKAHKQLPLLKAALAKRKAKARRTSVLLKPRTLRKVHDSGADLAFSTSSGTSPEPGK
jgi:hypothetical protein